MALRATAEPLDQPMQTRGEIQMPHLQLAFQHLQFLLAKFFHSAAAFVGRANKEPSK